MLKAYRVGAEWKFRRIDLEAWIDRQDLSRGGGTGAVAAVASRPHVDFSFRTLGDMAAAVEAAFPR